MSLTQVTPDVISTNTISGLISAGFTSMNVATMGTQTIDFGSSNTLVFRANTSTERMRISSTGLVGIGTDSPNRQLVLYSSVNPTFQFADPTSTTAAGAGSLLQHTTATGSLVVRTYDANASIILQTTGAVERMRIANTGQVSVTLSGSASAPVISKSDDLNTGIFFPAADTIAFSEGGVESMRIDSAGNVAIGTTSSTSRLQVVGTDGTAGATSTVLRLLGNIGGTNKSGGLYFRTLNSTTTGTERIAIIQSTDVDENTRILSLNPTGGNIGIGTNSPAGKLDIRGGNGDQLFLDNTGQAFTQQYFRNNGNNQAAIWASTTEFSLYTYSTQPIIFHTNTTERIRIPSDAGGIQFPATQAASSNANTLDDYEEGTFTPTQANFTITGTPTLTGRYIKIGKLVHFSVTFTSTGTIAYSASAYITLPFTGTINTGNITMRISTYGSGFNNNQSGAQCLTDEVAFTRFFVGNFTTTPTGQTLYFAGTYETSN